MTRKYLTYFKDHYKLISSLIWISILIIFWQNIYHNSNILLNDINENRAVLKSLFFLQGLSFALPVIALKGLKKSLVITILFTGLTQKKKLLIQSFLPH